MNIQIKNFVDGGVVFECDFPENSIKKTVEFAVKNKTYLIGADLSGAKITATLFLVGFRPIFKIFPLGSRNDCFMAFLTNQGVFLRTGCFFGSVEDFKLKLTETHNGNQHGQEYEAALVLVQKHAELWGQANG